MRVSVLVCLIVYMAIGSVGWIPAAIGATSDNAGLSSAIARFDKSTPDMNDESVA